MSQEERGLADEETRERDGLFERAERLVSALASIQDTLKDAEDDVNAGMLSYFRPFPFPEWQSETWMI